MNLKKTLALATLVTVFGFSQTKANSYAYNFNETDGGYGVTGTITLDSASSNNGSLSDILGISFSDYLGDFSFTFDPTMESLVLNSPAFTWTSSAITQMNIGVIPNGSDFYYEAVYDNGLWYAGQDVPDGGNWLAADSTVPDTANTFALAALALGALFGWSRMAKIHPVAIGK